MSNINFLEETISFLDEFGKTEKDVLWVGRGFCWLPYIEEQYRYKTTWEDFKSKADFYYDDGFGLEVIPRDLIIVGKDFWLERDTYDGQEWWEYKTLPPEPEVTRELDFDHDYIFPKCYSGSI